MSMKSNRLVVVAGSQNNDKSFMNSWWPLHSLQGCANNATRAHIWKIETVAPMTHVSCNGTKPSRLQMASWHTVVNAIFASMFEGSLWGCKSQRPRSRPTEKMTALWTTSSVFNISNLRMIETFSLSCHVYRHATDCSSKSDRIHVVCMEVLSIRWFGHRGLQK